MSGVRSLLARGSPAACPPRQEAIGRELEGGLRLFTPDELRPFDGQRSSKIYLAIMGQVYDVSSGERHYGERGREGLREAELRGLARQSTLQRSLVLRYASRQPALGALRTS